MHPHQHRIDLCNRALDGVRHAVPADLTREVHDCINRFDEWGLGMEMLIDQLIESGIRIAPEQFDLIQAAMDAMGLGDSGRVGHLRDHAVLP